jgi:hypothetical protein
MNKILTFFLIELSDSKKSLQMWPPSNNDQYNSDDEEKDDDEEQFVSLF